MKAVTRLLVFAVVLGGSFGAGAALGAALPDLGPDEPPVDQREETGTDIHQGGHP